MAWVRGRAGAVMGPRRFVADGGGTPSRDCRGVTVNGQNGLEVKRCPRCPKLILHQLPNSRCKRPCSGAPLTSHCSTRGVSAQRSKMWCCYDEANMAKAQKPDVLCRSRHPSICFPSFDFAVQMRVEAVLHVRHHIRSAGQRWARRACQHWL